MNTFIQRELIDIPIYQRTKVWSKSKKSLLIDSVIRDYDIPKLYFSVKKISDSEEHYRIIDGQQRLDAISSFFDDKISLPEDAEDIFGLAVKGLKFSQLPNEVSVVFENFKFDVVYLYNWDAREERELYTRLQNGTPNNPAEKRRSFPYGDMPNTITSLSNHKIFKKESLLGFKDHRFSYEDICAKIFHQFYKNDITAINADEIWKTYGENKDIKEDSLIAKSIKKSFNLIFDSFEDKHVKLMKYGLLRLTYLISDLDKEYNIKYFKNELANIYIDFEKNRKIDRQKNIEEQDPLFIKYSDCTRGDSVENQNYIHNTLKEEILKKIPELENKDQSRAFNKDQRWLIFQSALKSNKNGDKKYVCQADRSQKWYLEKFCLKEITFKNFHADHIVPFDNGGKTTLENAQALCGNCNRRKSNQRQNKATQTARIAS